MKMTGAFGKSLFAALAFGALVLGVQTLSAPRAEAKPPGLLCGPTILWICSGPGGPDVLFGGTICEKFQFEKKTGKICVPYGGF